MKIVSFRKIERAGLMVATFDIQLENLIIRGVTLFRKDTGETWINEPSEKYACKNGRIAYKKHVVLTDRKLRDAIREQAKQYFESSPMPENNEPY